MTIFNKVKTFTINTCSNACAIGNVLIKGITLSSGVLSALSGTLNTTILMMILFHHEKIDGFMNCAHQPNHLNYNCYQNVNKSWVDKTKLFDITFKV
jgi:hypothetical protein